MDLQRRLMASFIAQLVKNLCAMQETWVCFLGWEDSPGEENGNPLQYSSLEDPMGRGAWQATVHGVARVRQDLVTTPPPPKTFTSNSSETVIMLPYMMKKDFAGVIRLKVLRCEVILWWAQWRT